jgi:RNA polymerase sigma-70 factor (ECF subfamily)
MPNFMNEYRRIFREFKLLNYARSLTRGNQADAEDLVQQAMMKLLYHRDTFDFSISLFSFAKGILRGAFHENLRKAPPEIHPPEEVLYAMEESLEAAALTYERMDLEQILGTLRRRHPKEIERLLLVFHKGYSYAEIAEMQGCSTGSIKASIQRCREQARRAYPSYF